MSVTLRPFQADDAEWLAPMPHAFLLHETRVGKTYSALAGYAAAGGQKLAVLGPAIARGVWRRAFAEMESPGELLVDSYDRAAVNDDLCRRIMQWKPDVLVLDEAHRLRTPSAKRTRIVYGHRCQNDLLASHAGAVWRLSGTLAPKHLGETWTHLHAAGATERGYHAFLHRYTTGYESPFGWKPTGTKNVEEFRAMLAPLSRRLRRRDVYTTLDPRWNTIPLEVTAGVKAGIEKAVQEAKLDRILARAQSATPEEAAALLASVEIGATHLQSLMSGAKMPLVLQEAIELLDAGIEKLVIVGWHKAMLEGLVQGLKGYGAELIYGPTPEKQRWARMDRFQTEPDCRVLVGQIETMGEAIALSASRHILFAEYTWSLGKVIQAATRIFNPDHTEPMEVMVCSLAGTVDDALAALLLREAEQHRVLNSLGGN